MSTRIVTETALKFSVCDFNVREMNHTSILICFAIHEAAILYGAFVNIYATYIVNILECAVEEVNVLVFALECHIVKITQNK